MPNSFRTYLLTGAAAFLLTGFLFFVAAFIPLVGDVDIKGRDLLFRLNTALSSPPQEVNEILLVNLDDETLRRLQARWPYPRSMYAEVLDRLKPFSPRAIGFDLIFSGDDFARSSDVTFADALKSAGNVVIAAHQSQTGEIGPSNLIRESAWQVGIVDKPRDRDRIIRGTFFGFPGPDGTIHPSWEVALLQKAFPSKAESLLSKKWAVINYRLRFNEFPQVSFWRLLEGSVLDKEIRSKIILFGLTAEAFHDIHTTPLGSMPGLAVNANVLLMLMDKSFFSYVPHGLVKILTFLSLWLVLLCAFSSSSLTAFLIVLFLTLLYLIFSFFLFSHQILMDLWLVIVGMVSTLITAILFREGQLFFENMKLREEAARDPLTGFYNRRFLVLKLKSELKRLGRKHGWSKDQFEISVVMLDLDNFKLVNDSFGHPEGDRVLSVMASAIRTSVRKNELVCRYGGDEFCVILPDLSIQNAAVFAEKIRKLIENNPDLAYRTAGKVATIRVTASIGVASVSGVKAFDPDKLLKAADRALYRAKSAGRNQVCVFDPKRDVIT